MLLFFLSLYAFISTYKLWFRTSLLLSKFPYFFNIFSSSPWAEIKHLKMFFASTVIHDLYDWCLIAVKIIEWTKHEKIWEDLTFGQKTTSATFGYNMDIFRFPTGYVPIICVSFYTICGLRHQIWLQPQTWKKIGKWICQSTDLNMITSVTI